MTAQGSATGRRAKGSTASRLIAPTKRPRVAAPAPKPINSSTGESGGVMKSPISPLNFACSSEEEELAKALERICIITRPGATKVP